VIGGDRDMKKIYSGILSLFLVTLAFTTVSAAPNNANKAENNPQVVAYYPIGLHAIPTDPIQYVVGTDLVTTRGNSGQIEAWYTAEDGHGYHSVWNISKKENCGGDKVLIANAYPSWGDYLVPGADYCVGVNAF
jgi:hypothetical protein